jgi:zinc protease
MVALALEAAVAAAEEPRAFTLPNGLRVLLAPEAGAAAVNVSVWYRAGLAVEPAGCSGLTHLMERLMFAGSPRFGPGEYGRRLSAVGANYNTFLAPDYSCFYSSGPPGALETALELEADRMAGQRITPASVAAEKRYVDQDRRRLIENPYTRGLQQLYATAFGTHPYANPLQGKAADGARLTAAACTEYARARYGPGNALLTVTGAFDPAALEPVIRSEFGAVARHDPPPARAAAPMPTGERRSQIRVQTPGSILLVGWRAPADSACGPELQALAQVLSDSLSAELSGRRLAVASECVYDGRREASLLYADAGLAGGADSMALESTLVARVERLASDPLSTDDLQQARKALLIAARLDRQTSRGRAQALGSAAMIDGDWRFDAARLARIEALVPEDVQRVARQVLRPDHRTVLWVSPPAAVRKGARP